MRENDDNSSPNLTQLLTAARIVSGSDNKKVAMQKDLDAVLRTRLSTLNDLQVNQLELTDQYLDTLDTEALQYQTGNTAFLILDQIHTEGQQNTEIDLSLNDQSALRRLVALVSRWKLSNELETYNSAANSSRQVALDKLLESIAIIARWVDPNQANVKIGIVGAFLRASLIDFLPALFTVAWSTECPEAPTVKAAIYRLLSRYRTSYIADVLGLTLPQINAVCLLWRVCKCSG
jgi:hypothetical protein